MTPWWGNILPRESVESYRIMATLPADVRCKDRNSQALRFAEDAFV